MATLKYLSQYFSTTLNVGGGIDDSQTTGIILQSVSGVHDITEPGQICITYSDPIDTAVAEWIDYTSINGSNELVGAVRGREGFSAHTHLQNATVAFVFSASHHNDVVDLLNGTEAGIKVKTAIYDANGNEVIKTPATASAVNEVTVTNSATGNAVQVSATGGDDNINLDLAGKGTGAVRTTSQVLTTPVLNGAITGDAIATGATITTGTANDDIVTSKALADATVGKLGAAWTAFDPTIANLTVGSGGTKSGYYMQIGKTVFFRVYVKLGTSSSVGALDLTLPVTPIAYPELVKLAEVTVLDAGTAYIACSMLSDTTLYAPNVSATYITHTTFSSSVPMTWTTNDALSITGFYEAA